MRFHIKDVAIFSENDIFLPKFEVYDQLNGPGITCQG